MSGGSAWYRLPSLLLGVLDSARGCRRTGRVGRYFDHLVRIRDLLVSSRFLLGFDDKRFTDHHAGGDLRLTGVQGRVVYTIRRG